MKNQLTQREVQIREGFVAQQKIVQSLFGDKKKSDKFLATAVKVANNEKLSSCNVNSIVDACITVAQLNLDLSPALGHAYLVPFKGIVQLIVSARGYTALLARNGWKLKSYIVNEEDGFEYIVDGFDETIKFKKNIDSENETFKYAVALAQSADGTIYIEVMNAKQIHKHRKVSSNQKSDTPTGIWVDWFNEMAKKTVIKKLVKNLPLGEDIAIAVDKDDKPIDVEIKEEPKKDIDLNDLIPFNKPQQKDIEIEVSKPEAVQATPKDEIKKALINKGAKEDEVNKWCEGKNDEIFNQYLNDPATIDVALEEAVKL